MKFQVIGCSGGQVPGSYLSSYLVNDNLLIDAGSTTAVLDLEQQQKISNILITHVHLDHILSLATMADNLFGRCNGTINVWGHPEVTGSLKSSFFNDSIWPDFSRMTSDEQPQPVITFRDMTDEKPTTIGDSRVTMVQVNHVVTSTAFFIESKGQTLLHVGDTGPTERVWSMCHSKSNLCGVVLEASFPNRMQELADLSRHLTPRTLAVEIEKLKNPSTPILVTHLKPQYRDEIVQELKKLGGGRLRVLSEGDSIDL
ncbi:MAG: MBL fold metallo-hydrolase [Deltaproteobacteria bacterium]|nr:MBL fold metallo-hydrolase [Deltaproteobacteria bacterium]